MLYSNNALHKHIKYKAYTNFLTTHKLNTPHRIRSTFSTILYDLTPKHKLDFSIIEMCLSHSVGNIVIRSYNHSERMLERRELIQFWSDYIDKLGCENNNNDIQRVANDSDMFMFNPNSNDVDNYVSNISNKSNNKAIKSNNKLNKIILANNKDLNTEAFSDDDILEF